jgi:hypothetical protein
MLTAVGVNGASAADLKFPALRAATPFTKPQIERRRRDLWDLLERFPSEVRTRGWGA